MTQVKMWLVLAWTAELGERAIRVDTQDREAALWMAQLACPRWKGGQWSVEPVQGPVAQPAMTKMVVMDVAKNWRRENGVVA